MNTLILQYIGHMNGLKKIAQEFLHKDPRSLKKELKQYGIKLPSTGFLWKKMKDHYSGRYLSPFETETLEIIDGMLLGDLNIRVQHKAEPSINHVQIDVYRQSLKEISLLREKIRKGNELRESDVTLWNNGISIIQNITTASIRVHKSSAEFDFVRLIYDALKCPSQYLFFRRNKNKTGIKWNCGFDTLASVECFEIWNEWYFKTKYGYKKRIPRHRVQSLTPNILFHYYLDDGWYSGNRIQIANRSFSASDIKYLVRLIRKEGIDAKPESSGKSINISHKKKNRDIFFEYISNATLYKELEDTFPHKLIRGYSKKDYHKFLRSKYPEFYDESQIPDWKIMCSR